jgi:hypothetical protein
MPPMKPPMLAPDPATRRAVEKAARALRTTRLLAAGCHFLAAFSPEAAAEDADVTATVATIAAYFDALGQDASAARVRRCLNTDGKEEG